VAIPIFPTFHVTKCRRTTGMMLHLAPIQVHGNVAVKIIISSYTSMRGKMSGSPSRRPSSLVLEVPCFLPSLQSKAYSGDGHVTCILSQITIAALIPSPYQCASCSETYIGHLHLMALMQRFQQLLGRATRALLKNCTEGCQGAVMCNGQVLSANASSICLS
jgi:hypothetical protein